MARPIAVLMLLAAPAVAAAQTPRVGSLYPQQAVVRADHIGLVRLPLGADVIAACAPDLSDLRVFHGDREIAYYVDADGRATQPLTSSYTLQIMEAERIQRPVQGGPPRMLERYTLALPPEMSQSDRTWTLDVHGTGIRYVRRVVVHAADEDGTLRRELARGTIFRLPNPRAERGTLVLPTTDASRIVVELEGDGTYLEPSFGLISRAESRTPAEIELPLEELSRTEHEGVTTIRLRRPRGFVPDRLSVRTAARTFHVGVTVRDASGNGDDVVGNGDVFRIADLPEAESLRVELGTTQGEVLEIDLEPRDGQLPDLQLVGVVRQPALIFDHEYGSLIRFGGGRARKPDYGMASVLAGRRLGMDVPEASLGAVERNPDFDPSPALAFAMHPGREVDRRAFAHAQPLRVPSSPEGLVRVVPLPETLAAANGSLSDLRIVDSENRQWAFVPGAEDIVDVEQTLSGVPYQPEEDDVFQVPLPATRYEVPLPATPLYVRHLTIASPAAYVDREVTLIAKMEHDEDPYVVATGRLLVRPDLRRRALDLAVSSGRIESMYLVVSDGDDAPLRELEVELGYPTTPLYLPAPEGQYELLVGALDVEHPVYELASARDLIFNVSAVDATLGALDDNAAYEPPSAYSRDLWKDILLWVVLILGVLVLLVLTLRSAERAPLSSDPDSSSDSEPESASDADSDSDSDGRREEE